MTKPKTTPSSVDWKDEILEMVYSETRQQIQDYEKHKPPKLKKEFMIRAKAQLQAHINQAVVETLTNIGEPLLNSFEIKHQSYDDVVKTIQWYKSRIAELTSSHQEGSDNEK